MSKILVTTATGHVGSQVVAQLCDAKLAVRAAVRDPNTPEAQALAALGAEVVQISCDDSKSLDAALDGCQKMLFISPLNSDHQAVTDAWMEAIHRNKEAHANDGQGVNFIVRLSALGTSDPKSLVHKWHALTEVLLKATEIPCCFVRPGVFMQSIGNVIAPVVKASGSYTYPLNETKLVYIDVRDVARVIVKALSDDKSFAAREIDICGSKAYSQPEIAAIIGKEIGKAVEYVPVTTEQHREIMLKHGYPEVMADMICEFFTIVMNEEDGAVFRTPNESVKNETGVDAVTLEQFVAQNVNLFK